MRVLVTGAAGFIGSHVAERLLARGDEVIGVDNLNAYYDPALKQARLDRLDRHEGFHNLRVDVGDAAALEKVFAKEKPQRIVHLAAQAGVRYSLENPRAYVDSNIVGFLNILENCRHYGTEHLVYASTSSVYGSNKRMPFAVADGADHPVSLYAATKRANELMAHSYSHLFSVPSTGLRFFTVYGPWGRPDMALFIFTRKMLAGEPIPVFNHGKHRRDFTYVDDIAEGVVRVLDRPPDPNPEYDWMAPTPEASAAPYRVYNIGHGHPVPLLEYIQAIEDELGIKAEMEMLPMQPGDVEATAADVSALERDFGYTPKTTVREGVARFVRWYREYYGV
ncbi:MAG: NAD-dependent epimerase [Gammaproteobacteria bacterium]